MKDVHTEHCCIYHGCKYADEDCTVITQIKIQSFMCEVCDWSKEEFENLRWFGMENEL